MKKGYKKIILIVGIFIFVVFFLLYGPFSFFRELLITTSMGTKSHQYIADFFYSKKEISKVLEKNQVIEEKEVTNLDLIHICYPNCNTSIFSSPYERRILNHKKNSEYKVIPISGLGYKGHLVAIYNPKKMRLVVSSKLGIEGEDVLEISKRIRGKVFINGGGFFDPDWQSSGGIPHGIVIYNNKVISNYPRTSNGGFLGFTKDGKLFLGDIKLEEALKIYQDAIQFGPFLIINGKRNKVLGNGGGGIAPRSAIAQRKDGIVLLLVIDGRRVSSIGASLVDVIEIFEKYGAYNAVNLDGGSSSVLMVNQKIINNPVGGGKNNLRKLPTFWMMEE